MGNKEKDDGDPTITPEDRKRLDKRKKKREEKKDEKERQKEIARLREICRSENNKLQKMRGELSDLEALLSRWVKWRRAPIGNLKTYGYRVADRNQSSETFGWLSPKHVSLNGNLDRVNTFINWLETPLQPPKDKQIPSALQGTFQFGGEAFINRMYDIGTQKILDTQNDIKKKKEAIKKQEKIALAACDAWQKALDPNSKPEEDGGDGDDGKKTKKHDNDKPAKARYKFNIPMVKSAYYQTLDLQSSLVNNPNWTVKENGRKMWLGKGAGKGVLQADAIYARKDKNKVWRDFYGNKIEKQQLYGFRFLYNPMTVNMGWAVITEMSPEFLASGQDKAVAMAKGLLKSTIGFSLYLNRMEDMNHIDENGWRREANSDINPWPTKALPTEFNEDLKEIYKRGTMYDLEHLFAATYSEQGVRYESGLNGLTADWGWLTGYMMELHLGDGLRYKVRIDSLNVQHIVFNERMVPILSQVDIITSRYPDIPEYEETVADRNKKTKKKNNRNGDKNESGGK